MKSNNSMTKKSIRYQELLQKYPSFDILTPMDIFINNLWNEKIKIKCKKCGTEYMRREYNMIRSCVCNTCQIYESLCNKQPDFDIIMPIGDFTAKGDEKISIRCKECHTEYTHNYSYLRNVEIHCRHCKSIKLENKLHEKNYTLLDRTNRYLLIKCNHGHTYRAKFLESLQNDTTCPLCKSPYYLAMFNNAEKVSDPISSCKYLYCQPAQALATDLWFKNRKLKMYISLSGLIASVKIIEKKIFSINKKTNLRKQINASPITFMINANGERTRLVKRKQIQMQPIAIIGIAIYLSNIHISIHETEEILGLKNRIGIGMCKMFPKSYKKNGYRGYDIKRKFIESVSATLCADIHDAMRLIFCN